MLKDKKSIVVMPAYNATQTNTSGLMNILGQFFKWANRFYMLLAWLDARITPRSLSAVLLIKAEKLNFK